MNDERLVIEDERLLEPGRDGRVLGLGLHDEAEVVDQLVLGQGLQLPLTVVLGHRLVDAVLGGLGADPALLKDVLAKDWRSRIRVGGIAQR